jgi:hypothetical protein
MLHELWEDGESEGRWTFCLAGPMGDDARSQLGPQAQLVWTVEADNHIEAMTAYYAHMGWGVYTSDYPEIDGQSYAERGWS